MKLFYYSLILILSLGCNLAAAQSAFNDILRHHYSSTDLLTPHVKVFSHYESTSGDKPLYEAHIGTGISLMRNPQSALQLQVGITLRMYDLPSLPVLPPNFHPAIHYIHLLGTGIHIPFVEFIGAHLSNGQSEPFFLPDGQVNIRDGDFSTNYAAIRIGEYIQPLDHTFLAQFMYAVGFQYDGGIDNTPLHFDEVLKNSYGRHRVHGMYEINTLPLLLFFSKKGNGTPFQISIKGKHTYISGNLDEYLRPNELDRWSHSIRLHLYIGRKKQLSPFAQFYHGRDYYNLRFVERLTYLSWGLSYTP